MSTRRLTKAEQLANFEQLSHQAAQEAHLTQLGFKTDAIYTLFGANTISQKTKVLDRAQNAFDVFKNYIASGDFIERNRNKTHSFGMNLNTSDSFFIQLEVLDDSTGKQTNFTTKKQEWFFSKLTQYGLFPFIKVVKMGGTFASYEDQDGQIKTKREDTTIMLTNQFFGISKDIERELATSITTKYMEWLRAEIKSPDDFDATPIDMKSLTNYINTPESKEYKDSYEAAVMVRAIASEFDENLPNVKVNSEFGRTYYKGVNVHTVPKMVRRAMLGKHHQYDLNTAAQTIGLSWALEFLEEQSGEKVTTEFIKENFSYTLEYIRAKNRVREDMTCRVFNTTKPPKYDKKANYLFQQQLGNIKSVFTAIGFGAKVFDNDLSRAARKHHAIGKIFTSKTDSGTITNQRAIDVLINDEWLQKFTEEQELIQEIIVGHLKSTMNFSREEYAFLYAGEQNKGALSDNKIAAWLFQQSEAKIVNAICDYVKEKHPSVKILARVHDAICTDYKIDMASVATIAGEFITPALRSLVTLTASHEEYDQWSTPMSIDTVEDIEEHKQRIYREEKYARYYRNAQYEWMTPLPDKPRVTNGFLEAVVSRSMLESDFGQYSEQYDGDEEDRFTFAEFCEHQRITQ